MSDKWSELFQDWRREAMVLQHHGIAMAAFFGGPIAATVRAAEIYLSHQAAAGQGVFCSVCYNLAPFDAPLV